jgi:pimeloyl-ACP methyl ester carboxylesterase
MAARRFALGPRLLSWPAALLLAAACGGGGGDDSVASPAPVVEVTGQGRLESASQAQRTAVADIVAAVRAPGSRIAPLAPIYDVVSHRLTYRTTDAQGGEIVASGLVSVPLKGQGATSPLLAYQHATIDRDAQAPSNDANGAQAAVALASLGYIVVAADYVGYGASKGAPHPYLQAAPSAAAVVDLLTAARTWREREGVADNGQLFLIGYSEGGYVTVATQRALQAQGVQPVAVAAGAGPYDVLATLDELVRRVCEANPVLGVIISPGFQRRLSASVRREVRKLLIAELLGDDADVIFDPTFMDNYLADDTAAVERLSNVHDWAPAAPLRLFHGRDDQTVPYVSATRTLAAMRARGAQDVSLTECTLAPSRHIECVPPFLAFAIGQFAIRARDL